jgi:ribosomal protein S18 acetylase RimI-like enzyme
MKTQADTGNGAFPVTIREATRADYHAMVLLRARWLDEFVMVRPADQRWCPAACPVPDIEDERTLLKHITGADGRSAFVIEIRGRLSAYILCRVDEANRTLRIEGQTPRVLPGVCMEETYGQLLERAVQQALRSGLVKVKARFHGFPDEVEPLRRPFQARGFTGECKFEMVTHALQLDPGPECLLFRSADQIGLDAFCEAEAACGYCSSVQRCRENGEFSRKMWNVTPSTDWLAAYAGAALLGTVRVAVSREGIGVLDAIAVAPERRGRGIGHALLARGLAALVGRTDVVRLDVHHDNPAAIRLYQRAGFRVHHVHGDLSKDLSGREGTGG